MAAIGLDVERKARRVSTEAGLQPLQGAACESAWAAILAATDLVPIGPDGGQPVCRAPCAAERGELLKRTGLPQLARAFELIRASAQKARALIAQGAQVAADVKYIGLALEFDFVRATRVRLFSQIFLDDGAAEDARPGHT